MLFSDFYKQIYFSRNFNSIAIWWCFILCGSWIKIFILFCFCWYISWNSHKEIFQKGSFKTGFEFFDLLWGYGNVWFVIPLLSVNKLINTYSVYACMGCLRHGSGNRIWQRVQYLSILSGEHFSTLLEHFSSVSATSKFKNPTRNTYFFTENCLFLKIKQYRKKSSS